MKKNQRIDPAIEEELSGLRVDPRVGFDRGLYEHFHALLEIKNACNADDKAAATDDEQLPLFGQVQQPVSQPVKKVIAQTSAQISAAFVFSQNLRRTLKEENISLDEFIHRGPIGDRQVARRLLAGIELPTLEVLKAIADIYKIGRGRLLKDVKPEHLHIVV